VQLRQFPLRQRAAEQLDLRQRSVETRNIPRSSESQSVQTANRERRFLRFRKRGSIQSRTPGLPFQHQGNLIPLPDSKSGKTPGRDSEDLISIPQGQNVGNRLDRFLVRNPDTGQKRPSVGRSV